MGGFSGITSGNGWLIAGLGVSIVFLGLVSLAVAISYFPRLVFWWNAWTAIPPRERLKRLFRPPEQPAASAHVEEDDLETEGLADAETFLRLLTSRLGEPFQLPQLLEMAEKRGLYRPYSTINRFLLRRSLVGGADGLYRWKNPSRRRAPSSTTKRSE